MPVDKRQAWPGQAWTAQQKMYVIELKRKSPNKKQDDIIVAIKAKNDRDVSASTLHGWLKPENAAKFDRQRKRPERCKAYKDMYLSKFRASETALKLI
jgi:hypothetical protein